MTIPRSQQIDLKSTPYYHIMTRCVRRSYLCGVDEQTGKDYSHRKTWLVKRMKELASIFSIHICAYAVMSNHYHLVLYANKAMADAWSDEEVRERWQRLFPENAKKLNIREANGAPAELIKAQVQVWRERLTSISWYMRCLNEPIARMSNREDELTGRFWEGRFKSQALLDEAAVLTAMAYVDLNPIRANVANTPEESEFTSIYERIKAMAKQNAEKEKVESLPQPKDLMAFGQVKDEIAAKIPFRLLDYLNLVEATGRLVREDKRGFIPNDLEPLFDRLNISSTSWMKMLKGLEKDFKYVVGHNKLIEQFNQDNRARRIKGTGFSRACYSDL